MQWFLHVLPAPTEHGVQTIARDVSTISDVGMLERQAASSSAITRTRPNGYHADAELTIPLLGKATFRAGETNRAAV